MKKRELSERSQARVISSIRTYLKFCEKQGMDISEIRELKPPKVKVGLPKVLRHEDFQKLFDASQVEDVYRTARNQICLLLLFGLGCRVSELIGLSLHDLNETEGWLRVEGKGGKQRLLPATQNLLSELKVYLEKVRPHLCKNDSETSILINDRGRRPSRVDIWRWLKAWSDRAGYDEPISPHAFRHGCATALLEGGADLRSIQMLLGHSSIQTTQIYTTVSTHKIRQEIDDHHPLSKIKPK